MTIKETIVGSHCFTFNKKDNGGEALSLRSTFFTNGDPGIFLRQELSLNSYCNTATFHINFEITPDILRNLADELEEAIKTTLSVQSTNYTHETLVGSVFKSSKFSQDYQVCFLEEGSHYLLANCVTGVVPENFIFADFEDLVKELKGNWTPCD